MTARILSRWLCLLLPISWFAIPCIAQPWATVELVHAQEEEEEEEEEKKDDSDPEDLQRKALLELLRREVSAEIQRVASATLRVEVAELAAMFQLDQKAVRRLEIAASGAASRWVKDGEALKTSLDRIMTRRLVEPEIDQTSLLLNGKEISLPKADRSEATDDEVDGSTEKTKLAVTVSRRNASFVYLTVRYPRGSSTSTLRPSPRGVEEEEIWKETKSKVLTKDQLKQYSSERSKRLQKTIVEMLVLGLKCELHLTEQQLPAIRKRLMEHISVNQTTVFAEDIVRTHRPQIKAETLADLLTKPQLVLWESSQAYHRRYTQ
ncbi:MAG: hypothetical protein AB8G99_22760 [Planctomycetaceae bacterium]